MSDITPGGESAFLPGDRVRVDLSAYQAGIYEGLIDRVRAVGTVPHPERTVRVVTDDGDMVGWVDPKDVTRL